jgi:colicin import membrane protein
LPPPHIIASTSKPRVTAEVNQLAAANARTPAAPHRGGAARLRHARVGTARTPHAIPVQRSPLTVARSTAPRTESPVDLQRETRLADMQAMAGKPLSETDLPPTREGPPVSPGYAEKVAHRVRGNVVAPFVIEGNPSTVIAVTCAPNGALLSATVRHSSGNSQWDNAVLSAVEKSDPMPADTNGTAPARFLITFQAKG